MDEPRAWRELADRFTQLYAGTPDKLYAGWISSAWNEQGDQWIILGVDDPAMLRQFKLAAERAALLLGHAGDGLSFWLDLLKQDSPSYNNSGGISRTSVGGRLADNAETGIISALCTASAEYCYRLETLAITRERSKWVPVEGSGGASRSPDMDALNERKRMAFKEAMYNSSENRAKREFEYKKKLQELEEADRSKQTGRESTREPPPLQPESIGFQLDSLRENCRLTIEQLAEKVGINIRTVQRHLADKSNPYPRHLTAYERVFSKLLSRKVVIKKMP
jgi:hypothetical protein